MNINGLSQEKIDQIAKAMGPSPTYQSDKEKLLEAYTKIAELKIILAEIGQKVEIVLRNY